MRMRRIGTVALIAALAATSAWAWGPGARLAIVSAATHIISREERIRLQDLERAIQDGAAVPASMLYDLHPAAEADPIRAIETEMALLQRMCDKRVDPYLAFRLGVLGKLVSDLSAPMSTAPATYRNLYYADTDKRIGGVALQPSERRVVAPLAYFSSVKQAAGANDATIIDDYKFGRGFEGAAEGSFGRHANRSVNAVADVWYTILTNQVKPAGVAESRVRDYLIRALAYYLRDGNMNEADKAYRRLFDEASVTPDLRERIGDMYYEAGHAERAMVEYEAILAQHPEQETVAAKISAHYKQLGDRALAEDNLENASEAYKKAIEAEPVNVDIRSKLREADTRLEARTGRLEEAKRANEAAAALENEAQRAALRGEIGVALELLYSAEELYRSVSEEFPRELSTATVGLRNIAVRRTELKNQLILQAQQLSGSGVSGEMTDMAEAAATALNKQGVESIIENQYKEAVRSLEDTLSERLLSGEGPW